ncbi:hypothetical protein [Nocardia blacklockiae]|uniref:hypothetical protein n=1 Tax=Nocardia blacklockiae TaxID=480036 RepID=UPI001893A572|nr:hypothetical protein [Nocardia blacklockiae]MBF6171985.1 hypothetical protein [Nocardia blacklockiae]
MAVVVFRGSWWEMFVRWGRGPLPDGEQVLGHSMLFWGRLGKGMQFVAGLPVLFDLIGAGALADFGRRHAERLAAARVRVAETRSAARLLERLRALERRVQSELIEEGRERGAPEHELLLASVVEAFDGEIICTSCEYAMPRVLVLDDIPVVAPKPLIYKWECQHGREVFESRVEKAFVDTLTETERAAWRNAEYVDRRVARIGSILLGALVLGGSALLVVEWTVGQELRGLMAAVAAAVIVLAVAALLTTDPNGRRRAGAGIAWLWALVCWLPVPITRSIVWLMNRDRPAHPLRWIALCLFVFGSLLDLVAS